MRIEKSHKFSSEEATERITALSAYWKAKYGVSFEWDGNRCSVIGKVFGFSLKATIDIGGDRILFEGPNPPFFVKKKVVAYMDHKLGQYLDPNSTVEALNAKADKVS